MDLFSKLKRLLIKRKTEDGDFSEVVYNHQILERIFDYLDLKSLKSARLVCQMWAYEAGKKFDNLNLVIRLYPKLKRKNLEQLALFLQQHRLKHMLILSLLKPCCTIMNQDEYACWLDLEELMTGPLVRSYYNQQNRTEFFTSISSYLTLTIPYLTELRLEINLLTEGDAHLFSRFLNGLTAMRRLSLDIVSVDEKAVACLPLDCAPPSLQTLGFRVHPSLHGRQPLLLSSYVHFMRLFSKIKYLDLDMWRMWVFVILGQPETMERFIQVISTMGYENKDAFPNLTGLKVCLSTKEEWKCFLAVPISLRFISLHSYQHKLDHSYVETFQKLLRKHAKTLTIFNVFLFSRKVKHPVHCSIKLPYLPHLTTLVITSSNNLTKEKHFWELDTFNLRSLFLEQRLDEVLPSLKTLCILLPWEEGEFIWEHIFPHQTAEGEPLHFDQIECLIISLRTECTSPRISRLLRIFPKLKIFRHTQLYSCKHQKGIIGCEHRFLNHRNTTCGPVGKVLKKDKEHSSAIYYGHQMHHQLKPHCLEDPFFWYYVSLKF